MSIQTLIDDLAALPVERLAQPGSWGDFTTGCHCPIVALLLDSIQISDELVRGWWEEDIYALPDETRVPERIVTHVAAHYGVKLHLVLEAIQNYDSGADPASGMAALLAYLREQAQKEVQP